MLTMFGSDSIFLVLILLIFLIIFSLLAYFTIKILSPNSLYVYLSNFYFTIGLISVLNWVFIIRGFAYSLVYIKNLIFLSIGLMYFIFNFIIIDKLSYTNFKSRTKERVIETLVFTSWVVGLILLILSSIQY